MLEPDTVVPVPGGESRHGEPAQSSRHDASLTGLSTDEAARRLRASGPNLLKQGKRISSLQILLAQFKSLIIWILIAAGVISGLLGELLDAIAILSIVTLNAAIGFYQEFSAEKSIAALQKMTAPNAKVLRGGELTVVAASAVVVSDVLVLEAGDIVAADARLVSSSSLKCVESALTGESLAVAKQPATTEQHDLPLAERDGVVFMGTSVAAGTGRALVVATAMETELGRIAGLIDTADGKTATPLQLKLDSFGKVLVWSALGIVALLFGLGLLRGYEPFELLLSSVSLAVAAVPEGLPAVVTVALSLGAVRLARRRALMRKLSAVETLGSTSVICTDKTGTLTVGEMTVRELYVADRTYQVTGEGYAPTGGVLVDGRPTAPEDARQLCELATVLVGCNNAQLVEEGGVWKTIGDPTEGALLAAGAKAGVNRKLIEQQLPVQREFPFDSDRKRSTVVRRSATGEQRALSNGAPGVILRLCTSLYTATGVRPLSAEDREKILAETSVMAKKGLRVLASASRVLKPASPDSFTAEAVECELVFVGLSGMYDPPRSTAKEAIAKCSAAGVRVAMITGDHPDTAQAIARELGISSSEQAVTTGVQLDEMSDEELERRALQIAVYARVTAEHKLRIVRALKSNGLVVAMTGDGVNDAPAIKGADIGIAMGRSGTEVTKQAADMIITDDNFATIVAAVEEGRGIYDNIQKTLQYLLGGNAGELLLMTICVVVGLPPPLLPIHLLWINLVTDGLPALCLATDPIDSDVMTRKPISQAGKIADRAFLSTMAYTGFLTAGVAFAVYLVSLRSSTPEVARTSAFTVLVFAELLRALGARSATKPLWRLPFFSNVKLIVIIAGSIAFQFVIHHNSMIGSVFKSSPIPFKDGLLLLAIAVIPVLVLDITKAARSRSLLKTTAPNTLGAALP